MIAAAAPTFTYRPPLVGSRRVHRRALVFIAALAGLTAGSIAGGTPAIADPGHPTNYESTVVDVEPRSDGVRFSVAGGDAYLTVSVEPGHTVEIPGYFNEPYIRIDADQSVYVNENSEAFFINGDRYGRSEIPGYVKGSEPSWALVGTDGFYAWHDHRAHWMSLDLPPTVTGAQRQQVFPWSVPTVVNGMTTTVSGELVWVPSRNAIPAILAGMAALLPLLLWAPGRHRIVAAWLTTAGLIAFTLSTVTYARTPGDHREFPVTSVLAAIAVAIGLIAIVRRQRSSRTSSSYSTAAGALVLAIWGVSAVDVLWLPILPSPTSPAAQRMLTAAVLWSAIAIATVSVATVVLNRRRRDLADASVPAEETTPSHAAGSTPITSHSAELQLLATSTGGAAALHTFSVRRFPRQRLEGYAGIRQADCPSKSREREE